VLKEVKFFRNELKSLMVSMMKREDYSVDALFNTLCLYPNDPVIMTSGQVPLAANMTSDYINSRSLFKFFRRNGFFASKEDISAIIHRLDLNYDEVITKDELSKFIMNASKIVGLHLLDQSNIREPLVMLSLNTNHLLQNSSGYAKTRKIA
jgi:hypothetical protein